MSLDRRQVIVARAHSHALIQCVAYPAGTDATVAHARYGQSGGTFTLDGERGSYSTTNAGIGWSARSLSGRAKPHEYDVFVTWAEFVGHAKAVTTPERAERAKAYLSRLQAHQLGCLSYPGRWRGVPWIYPRNAQGMDYDEVAQWWQDVHMPEFRALRDGRGALVAELLAVDDEPADLLELLAVLG